MLLDVAWSSNWHSLFFLVANKIRIGFAVYNKLHVHCFGGFRDDFVSDDSICGGIIGLDGHQWLHVAHFCQCELYAGGEFAVDVQCPKFSFCC